jgi:hypothetical protein
MGFIAMVLLFVGCLLLVFPDVRGHGGHFLAAMCGILIS